MERKTKRVISEEVLGSPDAEGYTDYLVTTVRYEKGGLNYFNYANERRGYYLAVNIEGRNNDRVLGTVTRVMMFNSGVKALLEEGKAFSAKKLAALVPDPDLIAKLRETLYAKRAESESRRAAILAGG